MLASEWVGQGPELLLLHGLGGNRHSWDPIVPLLAATRTLVLVDLPGHGGSPLPSTVTFAGLADMLEQFVVDEGLNGMPVAGMSLGARAALELARRGLAGPVAALAPGGFWTLPWERSYVWTTLSSATALARLIAPTLPALVAAPASRALLLTQFSAQPLTAPPDAVLAELLSVAHTPAVDAYLADLAFGPEQDGNSNSTMPVTLIWGRHDKVSLPVQSDKATAEFPAARLVWLPAAGHYTIWDQPAETARLILEATRQG